MEEPHRNPKFALLKCPFPLREAVIGNMEFMDAFHFSTLSKRSKQMVRKARYQIDFIKFRFEENIKNDRIELKIKNKDWLKISLSNLDDPPVRYPNTFDGRKLANLINKPSDDYRKNLSAYLLSIFHFKATHVHLERNIEHLDDLFLWSIRKQFDNVEVVMSSWLEITPENVQLVLNNLVSKSYLLEFELDDSSYKYQETLKYCESLDVRGSCQWLDPENILQRNPQMKDLNLEDLPGEQVNNLLKQWINGEGIGLESMGFEKSWYNGIDYPDNVIFDGIDTMETKLTEEQANRMIVIWRHRGRTVDIRRKTDGRFATVHLCHSGCYVWMWHTKFFRNTMQIRSDPEIEKTVVKRCLVSKRKA